jgi:hypothetical protein
MTREEFIKELTRLKGKPCNWIDRAKSTRISNEKSWFDTGWIVASPSDWGWSIYGSIQNAERYCQSASIGTHVVGRHQNGQYQLVMTRPE